MPVRELLNYVVQNEPVESLDPVTLGFFRDGSVDVYIGSSARSDMESNWIQTISGKGWNMLFRPYGPLEPWFDKTWKLSEIELVK